jgi:uncharacterized protein
MLKVIYMKFVTGESCIIIRRKLVIADLHIGIEWGFYKSGIKIPSQTHTMIERLGKLVKEHGIKEIIILGDLKHEVPGTSFQEMREVPEFIDQLKALAAVRIISGNHDSDLGKMLGKNVKIERGMKCGDCYLSHGHMWPDEDFLGCKTLIIGHEHPQIEIRDALGYRFTERVWIRAKLSWPKISGRYNLKKKTKLPELIIMPAFNHFTGGLCLNSDYERARREDGKIGLGPLARSADIRNAEVFLIDGTHLGKIKDIKQTKTPVRHTRIRGM